MWNRYVISFTVNDLVFCWDNWEEGKCKVFLRRFCKVLNGCKLKSNWTLSKNNDDKAYLLQHSFNFYATNLELRNFDFFFYLGLDIDQHNSFAPSRQLEMSGWEFVY